MRGDDAAVDEGAVLHPHAAHRPWRLGRIAPRPELAAVVAHHWTVRWDAGDAPYVQDVIAHPNVHLAAEVHGLDGPAPHHVAQVHGVVRGTFRRELRGRGRVHGVKFRAGTFRDLLGHDVATLTGRVVPAASILGPAWDDVARRANELDDDAAAADLLDSALLERLPTPDPQGLEAADLVDRAAEDRRLTRVDHLAALAGVTPRTLQRLFARYVGVGPKWVVRTFRLHEAAAQLATGPAPDLARLAIDLGYSDQSHLTNDFRRAVGSTPADYAARQRAQGR